MANSLKQDERTGKLTTTVGDDVLVFSHLSAIEGLSELFEFRVEAVSLQANMDFSSALGSDCIVKHKTSDDSDRYFNGVITEARWAGAREDIHVYEIVLRPWLWLLTRTSDCRIFAQMSPLDIIKQVFSDRGFSGSRYFRDATSSSPPMLEYCVQYRETDYNFVCRLMEQYGIYYFFEHSAKGEHILVLADGKSSHKPVPGLASLPFIPTEEGGRRALQYVESWSRGRRAQSGVFVLEDYAYKKPSKNLLAQAQKPGGYAHDSMEIFDYPYSYVDREGNDLLDQSIGEKFAKFRVEAVQSMDNRRASTGVAPSLFPGALITLERYPDGDENQQYLVTHCYAFLGRRSLPLGRRRGRRRAPLRWRTTR